MLSCVRGGGGKEKRKKGGKGKKRGGPDNSMESPGERGGNHQQPHALLPHTLPLQIKDPQAMDREGTWPREIETENGRKVNVWDKLEGGDLV